MVNPRPGQAKTQEGTAEGVSAVVVFSVQDDAELLNRALFGLATCSLASLQAVVVVRNGTAGLAEEIAGIIRRQPFPAPPSSPHPVRPVHEGTAVLEVGRHRVVWGEAGHGEEETVPLAAEGLRQAEGRYLFCHTHRDALYHRALERLVLRARSSIAPVVIGCRRRVFARRPEPGAPWQAVRKSPPLPPAGGVRAVLADRSPALFSCLVDRHRVAGETVPLPLPAGGPGGHRGLAALAARYRIDLCGFPVAEVLRGLPASDLDKALAKDWLETMDKLKASFLLNHLFGPRAVAVPLLVRVARPLARAFLARDGSRPEPGSPGAAAMGGEA